MNKKTIIIISGLIFFAIAAFIGGVFWVKMRGSLSSGICHTNKVQSAKVLYEKCAHDGGEEMCNSCACDCNLNGKSFTNPESIERECCSYVWDEYASGICKIFSSIEIGLFKK